MAHITIGVTATRIDYVAVESQTAFTIPFEFFDEDDLAVYQNGSLLTKTTHYTITPVTTSEGGFDGGTVTFVTGATLDDEIAIVLNMPATRDTDFPTSGPFNITTLNTWIDKAFLLFKQTQGALDRTAQLPEGYTGSFDPTLPVDITGSAVLAFNAGATAFEVGPTTAEISGSAAAAAAAAASATSADGSATAAAASAATAETYAGTQSVDRFNGTGSQTAFTLSATPASENNTSVYISGVYQQKDTYSVSGATLTFSAAPPSGTGNIEVMHLSTQSIGVDPSIGSVTTGAAGSSAAVSITSGGVLSFTIPQGDDGATGSTGSTGATGSAATVAVGSTTTGSAGSSAAVTNVGSSSAATFDFTIPKGDTGTTGTAATIAVGTVTTGAAGSSATIVNGGSSSAATFNFAIPRGDTGATGAAATIAAGTATGLTVGSAPTVTNSGSSSAATFNFGIPVGATGATGSTGATGAAATIAVGSVTTGAAGSSATVTNVGSSSAATFDFAIPQGAAGVGSGDVTGPSSAADNAIARFDATTGKLLQNSTVTLSDAGAIAAASLTLTTDLAVADGGTGSSTASAARTALGVDPAGTDNSTNVTLAGSLDYLTISGQEITRGAIVLSTDVSGTLPVANGGTGAGTFAANGILFGNGTSAVGATAVGTAGHILTSNGAGVAPTFQAAGGSSLWTATGSDIYFNTGDVGIGTAIPAAKLDVSADILINGHTIGRGAGNIPSNVALGASALSSNTSGAYNTSGGETSLYYNSSGLGNTAFGGAAARSNTTGHSNCGFGLLALFSNTTGFGHTACGRQALYANTTGNNNTGIGYQAGLTVLTTGSNNTMLGYQADASSATVSNEITLGNASIATLRCQVTSITALSDRRDKKDIAPLELGLDFVNSLNPVKFTWNTRDGAKVGQQEAGFIAQELDEAQVAAGAETYLDIVLKENLDKLEAAPGKLIPVLVKAIQELSAEVATLKEKING